LGGDNNWAQCHDSTEAGTHPRSKGSYMISENAVQTAKSPKRRFGGHTFGLAAFSATSQEPMFEKPLRLIIMLQSTYLVAGSVFEGGPASVAVPSTLLQVHSVQYCI
jgi:hypothetical protein